MTCARWSERWLWRDTCVARAVLEADDDAALRGLTDAWDAAFAAVQGGPGLPSIVINVCVREDSYEVVAVIDERARLARFAQVDGAIAHVTTLLGWCAVPGELWSRDDRWLWLVSGAPPRLADALAARDWTLRARRTLVEPDGGLCLGAGRSLLGELTALRVVHRPGLATPVKTAMRDPEELRAWLRGGLSAQQIDRLLGITLAHRLYFDEPTAAVEALADLSFAVPQAAPMPPIHAHTLRLGDTHVGLVFQGLTQAEHAQLRGLVAPLMGPPVAARHVLGMGAHEGGPVFQSMAPRQLRTARVPQLSTCLAHLDTQLQRQLLTGDTTHTLFLGSAVCKQGRVVLLTGPRRSGKTTLALHLVRDHGFHVVCDDYVIWGGSRVLPFPKPLRIRGEAMDRFDESARTGITVTAHGDIPSAWLVPAKVDTHCDHASNGLWLNCRRSDVASDTRWEHPTDGMLSAAHVRPPAHAPIDVGSLEDELARRHARATLHFFDFADAAASIARRLA